MPDVRQIGADLELLLSWGRYLYWAELRRRDWDKFMQERGSDASEALPEWLGVSCYWGASLYVVIEGWETAKFRDPVIEALLRVSNYRETLRRLRNATFHYQPAILSQKFIEFFRAPDVTLWELFLHEEFCRWLRDCAETVERAGQFTPEQSQEWRDSLSHLVGWLPFRPAEQKQISLKKKCEEIEAMLGASGSTSEAARDLRATLGLYDSAVKQTAELVQRYRRDCLTRFGLNPNEYIPESSCDVN